MLFFLNPITIICINNLQTNDKEIISSWKKKKKVLIVQSKRSVIFCQNLAKSVPNIFNKKNGK